HRGLALGSVAVDPAADASARVLHDYGKSGEHAALVAAVLTRLACGLENGGQLLEQGAVGVERRSGGQPRDGARVLMLDHPGVDLAGHLSATARDPDARSAADV